MNGKDEEEKGNKRTKTGKGKQEIEKKNME